MTTTLARETDPITSKVSGTITEKSPLTNTHMILLLAQFAKRSMTAEMAGFGANLGSTGYWKRVSDLKKRGLIEARKDGKGLPLMWSTVAGRKAIVFKITAKGRDVLRSAKGQKA